MNTEANRISHTEEQIHCSHYSQEKYTVRRATEGDLGRMMLMVEHSRGVMRRCGNMTQWVGYPTEEDLLADIRQGVSYVICETTGLPVGTFALVPGVEPTYGAIAHGRWVEPDRPYATVHRLAAMPHTHGIADTALRFAAARHDYLRADTHADNGVMRRLLERHGFVRCGEVYMADGSPREAYEWWRYDEVRAEVRRYVEAEVLPRYDGFDAAHGRGHARRVMARAVALAHRCGADAELAYVAAAMHDLGLAVSRERHHVESGRIVRGSEALKQWFGAAQREAIAQAAEDHRASATGRPRSLLGMIVAEADRDIEPETIVRRTVEYGMGHYPTLDREGHWRRTLQHLHEKYAEGGYITLWLDDSPNRQPLEELRALIADEVRLRAMFDLMYEEVRRV